MKTWVALARTAAIVLAFAPQLAHAADVPLLDSSGERIAYIADSDSTIYLWEGRPVAYLRADSAGGDDVYGFNGRHLGWFVNGMIWNHTGRPSCTTKDALPHRLNPLKGLKGAKPARAAREIAPIRPTFVNAFDDSTCRALLSTGA